MPTTIVLARSGSLIRVRATFTPSHLRVAGVRGERTARRQGSPPVGRLDEPLSGDAHEHNTKAPEGGAAVGGLTGALIGLGIPEIEAKLYEGKIRGGNIFIAAHVEDDAKEAKAKDLFERNGAHDITSTRESGVPKSEARIGR